MNKHNLIARILAATAAVVVLQTNCMVFAGGTDPSIGRRGYYRGRGYTVYYTSVVDEGLSTLIETEGTVSVSFSITNSEGDEIKIDNAYIVYSFDDNQILQIYDCLDENGMLSGDEDQLVRISVDNDKLGSIIQSNVASIDANALIDSDGDVNKGAIRDYLTECIKDYFEQDFDEDGIVTVDRVSVTEVKINKAKESDAEATEEAECDSMVGGLLVGFAGLGFAMIMFGMAHGMMDRDDPESSTGKNRAEIDKQQPQPHPQPMPEPANNEPKEIEAPFVQPLADVQDNAELFRTFESKIEDNRVKHQVQKLRRTADNIEDFLSDNPDKTRIARRYKDFYLPAALSHISKYLQLQEISDGSESFANTTKKTIKTLIYLNQAFDEQYKKLYSDQVADFDIDTDTLNKILENELGIKSIPADFDDDTGARS